MSLNQKQTNKQKHTKKQQQKTTHKKQKKNKKTNKQKTKNKQKVQFCLISAKSTKCKKINKNKNVPPPNPPLFTRNIHTPPFF